MRRSSAVAALLAACLLLVLVTPVAAFPLSTCTLSLTSTNAAGAPVDSANSGAADATQADPFDLEWEGSVAYQGSTTVVIKNTNYHVEVFGIPTPIRGGSPNDEENTTGSGSVGVAANAPFRVTGLYFVSGGYTGEGGGCAGSGWFRLLGNPIGTLPFFIGLGLLVLGLALVARGAMGHALTAVFGGVLTGLGLAVLLVISSTLLLAEQTPLAALGAGVLLGIVAALIGRRRTRREDEVAPLAT